MDYEGRRARLGALMAERNVDALLLGIASAQSVNYLTGVQVMVSQLLVSQDDYVVFAACTEFFEVQQYYPDEPLRFLTRFTFNEVAEQLRAWGVKRLGVESGVPFAAHAGLKQAVPEIEITLDGDLVNMLQRTKDEAEIALMRHASEINDQAMLLIQSYLKPGVTERQIAAEAYAKLIKLGADHIGFLLVQFGPNAALSHCTPTDRALREGDFVLLDWGPVYRGYASDVTRTWVVGQPTDKQRQIHALVREAQERALAAVKPGMLAKEADKVARDVITAGGYGEAFVHRLGHGMNVGPVLTPTADEPLQVGDAFSIEPGVYLPGWGGVRIEDTVVLTQAGGVPMDRITKDLLIL